MFAGRTLYRVQVNPDCIKESYKQLINGKRGDDHIVDYAVLDKRTAVVQMTRRIMICDIDSQQSRWEKTFSATQPCMMLAPNFQLLKYPIMLSLSRGENDYDRKLIIDDLQDSGYSGESVSISGLKVLACIPPADSANNTRLNVLVCENGILRTLQLTFS